MALVEAGVAKEMFSIIHFIRCHDKILYIKSEKEP